MISLQKTGGCFAVLGGVLAIVDNNIDYSGNDFALATVPDGGVTSSLLGMGFLGLAWVRRTIKK